MVWLAAIGAGVSIAGGYKASKKAKKAGRYNANLIRQETAEAVRRSKAQLSETLGYTRAAIAASGVQMSGSAKAYTEAIDIEGRKQIGWIEKAGGLRAKAAKRSGTYIAGQAFSQGLQSGINQGISAFNYYQYTSPNSSSSQNYNMAGGIEQ